MPLPPWGLSAHCPDLLSWFYGIAVDWDDPVALGAQYALPNYEAILDWSRRTYRRDLGPEELPPYLAQAATPGGITEAILDGVGQKHLSLGDRAE